MKHYFSTLAAILTAVWIVFVVKSCSDRSEREAQRQAEITRDASPTPVVPATTPAPSFVRVTLDTQVYGGEGETVTLKSGTRVRVLRANGPALLIEYQGKSYAIDAAITTPDT